MPRLLTASATDAQLFYEAALAAGHEGLVAKSVDAPYQAGNRDARWLKIKRAHTLDLVVLAAEWGHGRRTGKLSNLHLGALDPASGEYVMLGKTFKGLTDAMLEWQTARVSQARDAARSMDGVSATRARGRDCLQRSAEQQPLPWTVGAQAGARQTLPR